MKHKLILTFGLIVVVFCTACATIVSTSVYPVEITSDPDGVEIVISDISGKEYFRGNTPSTIELDANAGFFKGMDYLVTFSHPEFGERTVKIYRGIDNAYSMGNLLIGWVVGWLIVDPISGAMWTLEESVHGCLQDNIVENTNNSAINLMTIDQLPEDLSAQLIRINE